MSDFWFAWYFNIQCINVCLCLRFTSTTLFPTSRCSTFHDLPKYPLHEYGLLKGLGIMFVLCEPRSSLSSTPLPLEKEILFGNHDFRFHFNFHGCSLFKDIFMMIFEILNIFVCFFHNTLHEVLIWSVFFCARDETDPQICRICFFYDFAAYLFNGSIWPIFLPCYPFWPPEICSLPCFRKMFTPRTFNSSAETWWVNNDLFPKGEMEVWEEDEEGVWWWWVPSAPWIWKDWMEGWLIHIRSV